MRPNNRYEQQFLKALKSVFVGAAVEGDSGYINLMRVKSAYFEQDVFPKLQQEIEAACRPFAASFREELFEKLYDFFARYFSESGSIYFRHTAPHQSVYERVYADDRDVLLFWKTHMLYYVKTDRLFTSMEVSVDDERFFFDVSQLAHKRANEKRELVYAFTRREKDGRLNFAVSYSERGRKTKVDEILRQISQLSLRLPEETLLKAFRVFEKQAEVDYFINKNAGAFLQEQFDLWLYQYLFKGETAFTESRLRQLQTIKEMAYGIVDYIARFEDELVRVWRKPKFARGSHYLITLDKLGGDLLADLFGQPGMAAQMAEWRDLGMLPDELSAADLLSRLQATDLVNDPQFPQYQYLPLDTRHFPERELAILALFDDLDAALDGWLIHSENYQALQTILPKFRSKITAIYIDPPYNTDASPIIYVNDYRVSTWMSMMDNRLSIAKELLKEDGILCATIDDSQQKELHTLIETNFGKDSIAGTVAIRVNPSGRPTQTGFALQHEYAIFARNDEESVIRKMKRSEQQKKRFSEKDTNGIFEWRNLRREGSNSDRDKRVRLYYPIVTSGENIRIPQMDWDETNQEWIIREKISPDEITIYPVDDSGRQKTWRWGHQRIIDDTSLFIVRQNTSGKYNVYYKNYPNEEGTVPPTIWFDAKYSATEHGTGAIKNLFANSIFSYPKSIYAVEDCIDIAGLRDDESICLDFFAGSGTTAHAVMNLNRADNGRRKYILVEMGDHFHSVILPRVKKVAFSDKWKSGRANGGQGMSHFVKYYALEQYEETLRRAEYNDGRAPLFAQTVAEQGRYLFLRDKKFLADTVVLPEEESRPRVDLSRLYPDIDLAETLSCLSGKWIKRITADAVEFSDGATADLRQPDWELIKPLIWW